MKIGSLETKAMSLPVSGERKAPATAPGTSAEPSAKVELSAAASALGSPAADPTFDTAKVERIAQAIREGRFTIDPEAIAEKLIANAQELLPRQSR
ncbi:MAG: flagellar biosynthesis anti-sigma factor FlgM [Rubrivivax sp.]|jgi:negative regulator of flagellin synthesis FlgM|nr:flagellar biosynthesis anti-sigma factor FlgM [Rubrivivax sp.]